MICLNQCMQLKSLGKISEVTKNFYDILKSGTGTNLLFAKALEGIDKQAKINIVSQTSLSEAQKLGILSTAGLRGEELRTAVQTGVLSASQTTAATSTLGLSTAFKGLWATLIK